MRLCACPTPNTHSISAYQQKHQRACSLLSLPHEDTGRNSCLPARICQHPDLGISASRNKRQCYKPRPVVCGHGSSSRLRLGPPT